MQETITANARVNIVPGEEKSEVGAVQLELTGMIEQTKRETKRQKRCIIFVIDKSGSMSGSRINSVKDAVMPFIDNVCENSDILIKVILFESRARSYDIPKDRQRAKAKLEEILYASGGTDFQCASKCLVEEAAKVLNGYELMVIICSDGEVSKSNAIAAHKQWSKFVGNRYRKKHKGAVPFVESIGISSNHDADILDGFIINDDNGNYTRANDSEQIREAFEAAADNAAVRTSFKLSISGSPSHPIVFVDNLYSCSTTTNKTYTLLDESFAIKAWIRPQSLTNTQQSEGQVDNSAPGSALTLTLNGHTKVVVSCQQLTDQGKIQQFQIDYYHQIMKDMINTLRNIQNESTLRQEAGKIDAALAQYSARFEEVTEQPAELSKLEDALAMMLNCEGSNNNDIDDVEQRALQLQHYKKVRQSWKSHRLMIHQFNNTLKSLKELLQVILTGNTRMQEIRQHILDLHFSKKHAKRLNKLILTDEQLLQRQSMYDNLKPLDEPEAKDLSDEYGSGCFLSTMTLRDCAEDGQALWLCGRVNRSGGIMVSNPEIIRIEYISPDLVCNEYFDMAMEIVSKGSKYDAQKGGIYDGSRNVINARLFPIYGGNFKYMQLSKTYLFEALSHTLSGRSDIKINDYSTLSAVLGYMCSTPKLTTLHLKRIFKDMLPSYVMLAKYIKVYPYANDKNKEVDFRAGASSKITLYEFFNRRLYRYCHHMQVRCSSLISNVQCLFGDALLTRNYGWLLQPKQNEAAVIWLCMIAQRLRSMIKNRIPGDHTLFTQARMAEVNHAQALRVIVRGTDNEDDVFANADDTKQDPDQQAFDYFEQQYRQECQQKKQRSDAFSIPSCRALNDVNNPVNTSNYNAQTITPSQVDMCAQILARVRIQDLILAHRFLRILASIESEDVCEHIDAFRNLNSEEKDSNEYTISAFYRELDIAPSMMTIRALCGFVLVIYTNSLFQNPSHYNMLSELITNPSVILHFLHDKVIAESRRAPRRMVARVKHKPSSPVDMSKRRPHNNLFPYVMSLPCWKDQSSLHRAYQHTIIVTGASFGKSTLVGKMLCNMNVIPPAVYKQKQMDASLAKGLSEFAKVVNYPQSSHKAMLTTIPSTDADIALNIIDAPNGNFFKNVVKTLPCADTFVLIAPAVSASFEQSIARRDAKKGEQGGILSSLPHCIMSLGANDAVIIVAVTMMDSVKYDEKAFEYAQQTYTKKLVKRGFKANRLIFVPICSLDSVHGDNITASHTANMQWYQGFQVQLHHNEYKGNTIYDAMNIAARAQQLRIAKVQQKALQLLVIGQYKVAGIGTTFQVKIAQGTCQVGDTLQFMPSNVSAQVMSIASLHHDVKLATAGQIVSIRLAVKNKANLNDILVGDVALNNDAKDKAVIKTQQITALVYVANLSGCSRIRTGWCGLLFCGSNHSPCTVKSINYKIAASATATGSNTTTKQQSPLYVETGDQAEIVLGLQKPMAISKFADSKTCGKFVVIQSNAPVLYGKIV